MTNDEKRVQYMLENYENIKKALADFTVKYTTRAVAIVLTAIPDQEGQIAVMDLKTLKQLINKIPGYKLMKTQIQARMPHYVEYPLILVECAGGIMRSDLAILEMRHTLGPAATFISG